MTGHAGPDRLRLIPALPLTEGAIAQNSIMDLAHRLRSEGWRINVAFESGDDGEVFTLSGSRAP